MAFFIEPIDFILFLLFLIFFFIEPVDFMFCLVLKPSQTCCPCSCILRLIPPSLTQCVFCLFSLPLLIFWGTSWIIKKKAGICWIWKSWIWKHRPKALSALKLELHILKDFLALIFLNTDLVLFYFAAYTQIENFFFQYPYSCSEVPSWNKVGDDWGCIDKIWKKKSFLHKKHWTAKIKIRRSHILWWWGRKEKGTGTCW